jgi:hypothetical protein
LNASTTRENASKGFIRLLLHVAASRCPSRDLRSAGILYDWAGSGNRAIILAAG